MKWPWQKVQEWREEVSKDQIIHELRIALRDVRIDLAEREQRIDALETQLANKAAQCAA